MRRDCISCDSKVELLTCYREEEFLWLEQWTDSCRNTCILVAEEIHHHCVWMVAFVNSVCIQVWINAPFEFLHPAALPQGQKQELLPVSHHSAYIYMSKFYFYMFISSVPFLCMFFFLTFWVILLFDNVCIYFWASLIFMFWSWCRWDR